MKAAKVLLVVIVFVVSCYGAFTPGSQHEIYARGDTSSSTDNPMPCMGAWEKLYKENQDALMLMLDATGKSIDSLGKFDQCIDLGTDIAHYCSIKFALTMPIPTPYIGVCLPAACSSGDLAAIFDIAKAELEYMEMNPKTTNLTKLIIGDALHFIATFEEYQKMQGVYEFKCHPYHDDNIAKSKGTIIMLAITALLVALVVVGTIIDGVVSDWWPEDIQATATLEPNYASIQAAENTPLIGSINIPKSSSAPFFSGSDRWERSKLVQFMLGFSVVRNFKALIAPSPPGFNFLNGVRAISITWIILGHTVDYMNWFGVMNYIHVVEIDIQKPSAQALPAAEFGVDTFFWMSGFLLAHLTLKELKSKKGVNWFLYYFHRIWRLTPAYFFALFFYIYVTIYMGDGPLWIKYLEQMSNTCGKYSWTNVLYINNFIPHTWLDMCFLWGWYLAVDFQLYIIAPIILVLYHKSRKAGWALVLALVAGCVVINGLLAHKYKMTWNENTTDYMTFVYGKPYTRAAPWLLGIGVAFLVNEKRFVHKYLHYFGQLLSATILVLVVYGPSSEFTKTTTELNPPKIKWTETESLMYFTFTKFAWSVGISFIFWSFSQGYGSFVRRFLGAHWFTPLARLTYSTYLWHPVIMFVVFMSNQQYFAFTNYNVSIIYSGLVIIAFGIAMVMFLLIERPMVNMEKIVLKKSH